MNAVTAGGGVPPGPARPMTALVPPSAQAQSEALRLSPGILSGGFVFVTGMTGSRADGSMPDSIDEQVRNAFAKIGAVLGEAGLGLGAIVEMTSYHVDLRLHFDRFNDIRAEFVRAPYPAWTAVEVAGLRREGALVEIRVVAAATQQNAAERGEA